MVGEKRIQLLHFVLDSEITPRTNYYSTSMSYAVIISLQ